MTCERIETEQIKIESVSFLLAACLCLVCALFFSLSVFQNSASFIEPQLQNRINPNTAETGSLIRLPNIGLSKATAIIDYRQNNGNGQVFETSQDLQKIKGIGPKTVEQLEQYLTFVRKDSQGERNDNGRMGNK